MGPLVEFSFGTLYAIHFLGTFIRPSCFKCTHKKCKYNKYAFVNMFPLLFLNCPEIYDWLPLSVACLLNSKSGFPLNKLENMVLSSQATPGLLGVFR